MAVEEEGLAVDFAMSFVGRVAEEEDPVVGTEASAVAVEGEVLEVAVVEAVGFCSRRYWGSCNK